MEGGAYARGQCLKGGAGCPGRGKRKKQGNKNGRRDWEKKKDRLCWGGGFGLGVMGGGENSHSLNECELVVTLKTPGRVRKAGEGDFERLQLCSALQKHPFPRTTQGCGNL